MMQQTRFECTTECMQTKFQLLIGVLRRRKLRIVMGVKGTPFFAMIILIAKVGREDEIVGRVLLMCHHFEVIDEAVGQRNVTAVAVVLQT